MTRLVKLVKYVDASIHQSRYDVISSNAHKTVATDCFPLHISRFSLTVLEDLISFWEHHHALCPVLASKPARSRCSPKNGPGIHGDHADLYSRRAGCRHCARLVHLQEGRILAVAVAPVRYPTRQPDPALRPRLLRVESRACGRPELEPTLPATSLSGNASGGWHQIGWLKTSASIETDSRFVQVRWKEIRIRCLN